MLNIMERKSKGRSRSIPDANDIQKVAYKLEEALTNDNYSFINYYERNPWEVSLIARNGAVHVLRFLKVWFDMPQIVYFSAVHYLDQFLVRMKVNEKYLSCVTISCFNVAAKKHGFEINASQLVMLSQSKCTVKDMDRMSTIIIDKLNINNTNHQTVMDLLTVYFDIFKCIGKRFKTETLFNRILKQDDMYRRLEILISDSSCVSFKPSVLALAFIQCEIEGFMAKEIPKRSNCYKMEMFYLLAVMIELQYLCKVSADDYASCCKIIGTVLNDYYDRKKTSVQKLNLRISSSTLNLTHQNFYPILGKIEEEH